MAITTCKDCVAPKRHPGCHATCPEYLRAKAEWDAWKAADFERRSIRNGLIEQTYSAVRKAQKHWRTKK
jgi:hypothetical protein